MGRKPREEYEGGIYHVIQRGHSKETVFQGEGNKSFFLSLLKELRQAMGYKVFGYVMMDNHYHMVLQTLGEPLQVVMQRINSRYSRYYNKKNDRYGYVFAGRYRAIPVLDEKYLLSLLRYVHQNPVKAGICRRMEEYRWSSDYLYRTNNREWVETGLIMDILSGDIKTATIKYIEFMAEEEQENYEGVKAIGKKNNSREGTEGTTNNSGRKSLDEILRGTGVSEGDFLSIKNGSRKRSLTGYKLSYLKEALETKYTLQATGQNINVSDVAVLDMLRRHDRNNLAT